MRYSALLTTTTLLLPLASSQSSSPKRGLCHVTANGHASDDSIWTSGPSNPTWYYNYGAEPSSPYTSDTRLQFVPMLWGASPSDSGTPFYDSVKKQIDGGANISYVLGFNEPDGTHATGGSNLDVSLAAARWIAEIEPLRKLGIKVGSPAVTGAPSGWTWLDNWFKACNGGCNPDFMAVHWYGDFQSMMSHLGRVTTTWPKRDVWVTEYGYPQQKLAASQAFYNQSAAAMDRWS
jgi:hypothetical protein